MYNPLNQCMYCGQRDIELTREHIIPYALGGTLVLPASSCKKHAKMTSQVERLIARTMYGIHRADTGAPSRRKKELKKLLDQKVEMEVTTRKGEKKKIKVPLKEQPRSNITIDFDPPGLLCGRKEDEPGKVSMHALQPSKLERQKFHDKYKVSKFSFRSPTADYWGFMRGLAKIAHSYAVAEVGMEAFTPYLVPFILGEKINGTHFVGCFSPAQAQSPEPLTMRRETINASEQLVVEISLHFFSKLPKYQVVVGKTNG